jgi:hypothetical protein
MATYANMRRETTVGQQRVNLLLEEINPSEKQDSAAVFSSVTPRNALPGHSDKIL